MNLQLGDINEEYVPDLKTLANRIRIFERMSNDPQVRGQLRAVTMTMVSGVRWKVEGGDTQEMRDLVESNLIGTGDPSLACSSSWLDFLFESLGCLIYGFSLFGVTRDIVDDYMVFTDLSWLHPRSVDEDGWVMDESDNLVAVRRSYADATGAYHAREPIGIDELFLMCWDRRGPNWEGNAFIRPMYKPWLLGEMAEKIDIIDLQNRGVAIPLAKLSGSGGVKERDTLVQMLKDMRGGSKERVFLVIDKESDISFLTSQGQARDAGPTLQYHGSRIVKAAGTEYFEQGNTATGSRAGASALATGFFVEVDAVRILIEDMINCGIRRMPGLVKQLIDMNFDGVKKYPRIVGSRVSPTEQLDNIPLIGDNVAKGVIPPHLKLANQILGRLGYELMSQEEWDAAMEAKKPVQTLGPGSPADGGPGRPNVAGPDGQGRDDTNGRRLMMQEEKKTLPGEIPPMKRGASYPWLQSIAG